MEEFFMTTPSAATPLAGPLYSAGAYAHAFDPSRTLLPFHKLDVVSAESMLCNTAFVDKRDIEAKTVLTHGSPGTYLVIPTDDPEKFKVIIVTETGDTKTETIRKVPRGWENATPGKVYSSYKKIIEHVLEGVRVLGDCAGIPVFNADQIKRATSHLIADSKPGAFVCFRPLLHAEEASRAGSNPRNVVMWKNERNIIEDAPFHYTRASDVGAMWENGAPTKPMDTEREATHEGGSGVGSTGGCPSPVKEMPKDVLRRAMLSDLIKAKLPKDWPAEPIALDTII